MLDDRAALIKKKKKMLDDRQRRAHGNSVALQFSQTRIVLWLFMRRPFDCERGREQGRTRDGRRQPRQNHLPHDLNNVMVGGRERAGMSDVPK